MDWLSKWAWYEWVWYVVLPVLVPITYFLSARGNTVDRHRIRELDAWHRGMSDDGDKKGPLRVKNLPPPLLELLEVLGGGTKLAYFALVPKVAYLAALSANATTGADSQAILFQLKSAAPSFRIRPLPRIDGKPVANSGILFKDEAFSKAFLVEGSDPKAVASWIPKAVRKALLQIPSAWIFVEGNNAALVVYGPLDVERLDALVHAADALFREWGPSPSLSLLTGETGSATSERSGTEALSSPLESPT